MGKILILIALAMASWAGIIAFAWLIYGIFN